MLNVTGSTGVWGPYPTDTYWNNISSGLSIGESFRRFLKYIVTSCNDLDAPKAVLLGDPTLRYKLPFVYNKAPYVAKNLASATNDTIDIRYKVEVGKTFEISPLDETGDTPIIEIEGLPSGANVQNTNGRFFWTPSYSDTGKVYNLKLTTYNKDDQNRIINKYVEEFSVAVVNYLFLDTFEDDTHTYNSWNIYNCLLQNLKAAQCEKSMQLNNNDTMTVSIDTTNYKDIKVEYFRATFSGLNSTAIFKCQWWDGYTWNTLESVTGIKPFQRQIFSLPSGASGNSDFKLRFLTNNKDNEYAFVDYVVVHGTNIP